MSISPVVRRALRFQDLLAIPGGDGPYLFTSMFRESGVRERRGSRMRFRLLKRVDGEIREIVDPSETVLFLTEGRGFSFWERWVLGWRRAVVLTDTRAIFLRLDAARRPRGLHRQLFYDAIGEIRQGRWGKLEVRTTNGEILELRGVRRADRPGLLEGLERGVKTRRGDSTSTGIEDLCPFCRRGVEGRPRSCPGCLSRFGRPWVSGLYSLAIPGLGNFLRGYRGFAVLELLMAVVIWAAHFSGGQAWGVPEIAASIGPEWIFAAVHGTDAALTWYLARGEVFR